MAFLYSNEEPVTRGTHLSFGLQDEGDFGSVFEQFSHLACDRQFSVDRRRPPKFDIVGRRDRAGGFGRTLCIPVSYTHLTLPTNREV